MTEEHHSLKEIMKFRREKLDELRAKGIDPYPHNFKPSHMSSDIIAGFSKLEGQDVVVAGRIMSVRKMGKASFFHLQDQQGRIQVYIKKDSVAEGDYESFKLLDIGDIAGVSGKVFETKTGEVSVQAKDLTVLAKSLRPLPVVKEKEGEVFDAFEDKEQRYRNRHLDLIVNPEVREVFMMRSKVIQAVRNFLDKRNFLEVETPVLQPLYGGANARPFTTHHNALDQKLYLRIADELYLKRLIIGGFDKVYEIAKDFRNEGMDRNHNPEFTMLEYYWAYADYNDNMDLVEEMFRSVAKSVSSEKITWGDHEIDLSKPFARKPIFDLLRDCLDQDVSTADEKTLRKLCKDQGLKVDPKANYGNLLDELMKRLVEPQLIRPTFVFDYPKAISPLAKTHRDGDTSLVERFELFIGGAEFANAFTELNDPVDQRERLEAQAALRAKGDEEAQPVDEDFIQAMECGMPPTSGVGIGIDRMVMLLTGQRWIRDVILFPVLRSQNS